MTFVPVPKHPVHGSREGWIRLIHQGLHLRREETAALVLSLLFIAGTHLAPIQKGDFGAHRVGINRLRKLCPVGLLMTLCNVCIACATGTGIDVMQKQHWVLRVTPLFFLNILEGWKDNKKNLEFYDVFIYPRIHLRGMFLWCTEHFLSLE